MALVDLTSPDAVLAAIREFDHVGRDEFLRRYGFGESRSYELLHEGKRYDSKAIVGAAHGHQHPDRGPLKPAEFSGGQPTIRKLEELGFAVEQAGEAEHAPDRTAAQLSEFLDLYEAARQQSFSGDQPASAALRSAARSLRERLATVLPEAKVRPSVGQGNWARVPWIAVLDPRVTDTTQRGTYPVILIPEDLSGIYLTLAQGVTELNKELGKRAAYEEMRRRADLLSEELTALTTDGFELGAEIDLGDSPLGRDYAASVIASMSIPGRDLATSPIEARMEALAREYSRLIDQGRLNFRDHNRPGSPQALCIYIGQGAMQNFEAEGRRGWWGWREAPTEVETLRPGDLVLFGRGYSGGSPRVDAQTWAQGTLEGTYIGRIDEPPARTDTVVMPDDLAGDASYPWKFRFSLLGEHPSIPLSAGDEVSDTVAEALRISAINRGHGQLAPIEGSPLLERYLQSQPVELAPVGATAVRAAADSLWAEVERSGMQLDRTRTLAFLSAALSKPFVILTGQSGSGKTQLAKRLGEWCGVDSGGRPRYLVVPVRPDWTGPEYLFGYPDGLRPQVNGRAVWSVPETLEFMFRAASEPSAPYLLLLDEMNLAHVERYFADFLSGIESQEPVLPALEPIDGQWVSAATGGGAPIPSNLIVVGTVNVDETTYLFSPKVLDRAFTFEFRVGADELDPNLRRPAPAPAAAETIQATLVALMRDGEWHFREPHPAHDELMEELRTLHATLGRAGLDFGHRVVFEALRFAAVLHAATGADRDTTLDFVIATKLLPKIHGSRQRLEQVLSDLLDFSRGRADTDTQAASAHARLPITATKLDRMLGTLRDAQFVSFTE